MKIELNGEHQRERAILVGCGQKQKEWEIRATVSELEQLTETAGAETIHTVFQFRDRYDAKWLVGKGKATEIADLAETDDIDLVIFDQELSPAQIFHLEAVFPCKVIDRTQLILDIFARRAQTKEGRLQVELAQLQYMLPRLTGKGKEMSRLGGGIGTRGPGEKKLETDRRHIRNQISDLKKHLEDVKKHRRLHQERRSKQSLYQIALVGYTNAGKSTLLNKLTGADVLAENQLFATLDPTTRSLELPSGKEVLITDTVGFIRNLPHHLIAAFRSTLEQVREANLLLHVVDMSHPEMTAQINAVEQVLTDLGAGHLPTLMIYNKKDLSHLHEVEKNIQDRIQITAKNDRDIVYLKEKIESHMQRDDVRAQIELPVARGEWIAELYRAGEVLHVTSEEEYMRMQVRMSKLAFEQLSRDLKSVVFENQV
ncbi:GTPase HflX [Hazenella sp. IB182357]|uniref:GTPase HflX n=1 Tax=Polycladospora coralii TaxID=2771432 RepID=A0A926RUS2_9BACL|nr:GTPase HflX [Polycladospora coralii]MBD1372932.1 GTPase HflX [Polycladospora coralii]